MRLRNIPGAEEAIASSPYCIQNPESHFGKWNQVFENSNPIHIEVGMGKGKFILQLALQNPSINYIGIEKYASVLLRAIQKLDSIDAPNNLRFICMNAENLPDVFSKNEIQKIYLNFSDPWPKDRHAKRRLTSREYLFKYRQILSPNGCLEFKTDNKPLFDFSIEEIREASWMLHAYTYDLHHDDALKIGNVMTEYEEKFSSVGNPICKLIASYQ